MAWVVWITKPHHSKLNPKPDPNFLSVTNKFTDKNEQAFLDACGAISGKPNAMVNTQKERYLVSEFLKNSSVGETDFALRNKSTIKASVKLDELLGALIRG